MQPNSYSIGLQNNSKNCKVYRARKNDLLMVDLSTKHSHICYNRCFNMKSENIEDFLKCLGESVDNTRIAGMLPAALSRLCVCEIQSSTIGDTINILLL